MIILRGVLGLIGILVESVRGIVPVPSSDLLDIPEDCTLSGCATAVLQLDGGPIHLLSPAALLRTQEDRLLANYSTMTRARLLHFEERN